MQKEIKMQRLDDGKYIVTVDGGNIECATLGAAMDIMRRETGDSVRSDKWEALESANKILAAKNKKLTADYAAQYEQLHAELSAMTDERDKYKRWWLDANTENTALKTAIVKWFSREFAK